MSPELLEAARHYLALGVNIIPTRGKSPALASWTEFQTRFATEDDLRVWKSAANATGIAAITGKLSGIAVVDVDDVSVLQEYEFPKTVQAASGRGVHLYFSYPEMETIKSLSAVRPSIDVKGHGGLITLPPSLHVSSGKKYAWVVPFSREGLASLPSWITEELKEKPLPTRPRLSDSINGMKMHRNFGKARNRISSSQVKEAKDYPIEDIASDHITLKRNGYDRLVGLCPFHDEKTPSFTIYLKSNTFYCFGCSKHGDGITLIRELEDLSFGQAVRNINKRD